LVVVASSCADVTALAPTFAISQFASSSPTSGTVLDFTTPQTYVVTAENGTPQAYSVAVQKITTVAAGYQNIVLAGGPVAYWPLNETNGSLIAYDLARGSNNLTYGGTLTQGQLGIRSATDANTCVLFITNDVSGPYTGEVGLSPSLNPLLFTIEAWIKPQDAFSSYLVSLQDRSGSPAAGRLGYAIQRNNTANAFQFTYGVPGNANATISSVTTLSTNNTYYVAATYDGTTMRLYINGNLESSALATYVPATPTQPGFSVGSRNNATGTANYIQDVALYTRALTAQEIQAHWQNRPILTMITSGANQILSWVPNCNGTLQTNSNLSGPFGDVPGATSPATNATTVGNKLFRVKF
jgi:hypothetical protein